MNGIKEWKDSIEEVENLTEEKLDTIQPEELNERLINALIASVVRLQNKVKSFEDIAKSEHEKIDANKNRLIEPILQKISKTNNLLELYMYKVFNGSNGKTKSYQGFYGTMGLRKQPDKVVFLEDEEKVIGELSQVIEGEEAEMIIKHKDSYSIDKKELKEFIKNNPKKLNTVIIEQGENKFYVTE